MEFILLRYGRTDMTRTNRYMVSGELWSEFPNLVKIRRWIAGHAQEILDAQAAVKRAEAEMAAAAQKWGVDCEPASRRIPVGITLIEKNHQLIDANHHSPVELPCSIRHVVVTANAVFVPGVEGPEWTIVLSGDAAGSAEPCAKVTVIPSLQPHDARITVIDPPGERWKEECRRRVVFEFDNPDGKGKVTFEEVGSGVYILVDGIPGSVGMIDFWHCSESAREEDGYTGVPQIQIENGDDGDPLLYAQLSPTGTQVIFETGVEKIAEDPAGRPIYGYPTD